MGVHDWWAVPFNSPDSQKRIAHSTDTIDIKPNKRLRHVGDGFASRFDWALCPIANESWVIAGDFNSSETFEQRAAGPRVNKEFLDSMQQFVFTECLRKSKGKLTPTFRHSTSSIKHQIDHLYKCQCVPPGKTTTRNRHFRIQ